MEYYFLRLLFDRRSSNLKCLPGFRDAFSRPPSTGLWTRPSNDAGPSLSRRMCSDLNPLADSSMVLFHVLYWASPQLLLGSDVPWQVYVHVCDGSDP